MERAVAGKRSLVFLSFMGNAKALIDNCGVGVRMGIRFWLTLHNEYTVFTGAGA